jgi:hypothetical protein
MGIMTKIPRTPCVLLVTPCVLQTIVGNYVERYQCSSEKEKKKKYITEFMTRQRCQVVYLHPITPHFGIFWKAPEWIFFV